MTLELNSTITLPAAPARVFQALVDERDLRAWFAEQVKVEARPGGAYQFWGKATLGAPNEPDASQVLTAFEQDERLAFGWKVLGQASEVSYALSPGDAPDTAKLALRHAVEGQLPFRSPKNVIDDLWRLNFANLKEHLRGRKGTVVLADFTSGRPEVRSAIEIAAPPAKVFRALLEPELMNKWLFGAAVVDNARSSANWKVLDGFDPHSLPRYADESRKMETPAFRAVLRPLLEHERQQRARHDKWLRAHAAESGP